MTKEQDRAICDAMMLLFNVEDAIGYNDDLNDAINILKNIDNKIKCTECNKPMNEGYCIEDGLEYYCSDECLHKHYSDEEYAEMYDEGNVYWTEWKY